MRRRSALWASVRSRGSRSSPKTIRNFHHELETPTKSSKSSVGPTPKLELKIPDLSLRDSQENHDDVTTPPKWADSGSSPSTNESTLQVAPKECRLPLRLKAQYLESNKQLWPSADTQLREFAKSKVASPSASPVLSDASSEEHEFYDRASTLQGTASEKTLNMATAEPSQQDPAAASTEQAKALRNLSDTGYASGIESGSLSVAQTSSSDTCSVKAVYGVSQSPTVKSNSRISSNGSLQSCGRAEDSELISSNHATVVPQVQKTSSGRWEAFQGGSSAGPQISWPVREFVGEHVGKAVQTEPLPEVLPEATTAWDADVEDSGPTNSYLQNAGMGSRADFFAARADREKRYAALKLISSRDNPFSDENSDSEPEHASSTQHLKTSPALSGLIPKSTSPLTQERKSRWRKKTRGLRKIRVRRNLRALEKDKPCTPDQAMTRKIAPSVEDGSLGAGRCMREKPRYVSADEYSSNAELRHRLHETGCDVVLYEGPWIDKATADTAPDRTVITSKLDPDDPLLSKMIHGSYAKRAMLERPETNGDRANHTDEDHANDAVPAKEAPPATESEVSKGKRVALSAPEPYMSLCTDEPVGTGQPMIVAESTTAAKSEAYLSAEDSWRSSSDGARGRSSKRFSPSTAELRTMHVPEGPSTRTAQDPTLVGFDVSDSEASTVHISTPSNSIASASTARWRNAPKPDYENLMALDAETAEDAAEDADGEEEETDEPQDKSREPLQGRRIQSTDSSIMKTHIAMLRREAHLDFCRAIYAREREQEARELMELKQWEEEYRQRRARGENSSDDGSLGEEESYDSGDESSDSGSLDERKFGSIESGGGLYPCNDDDDVSNDEDSSEAGSSQSESSGDDRLGVSVQKPVKSWLLPDSKRGEALL